MMSEWENTKKRLRHLEMDPNDRTLSGFPSKALLDRALFAKAQTHHGKTGGFMMPFRVILTISKREITTPGPLTWGIEHYKEDGEEKEGS